MGHLSLVFLYQHAGGLCCSELSDGFNDVRVPPLVLAAIVDLSVFTVLNCADEVGL